MWNWVFCNSLFFSSTVCPCLYEFMHQGGTVLHRGWQSRSSRSTHSLTDSSFISWQFRCTLLMAIKTAIQTKANCINRTCTCGRMWSQNCWKTSSASQIRTVQIQMKCVIVITRKLSEWIFIAAWSNQCDANQWSTQQHCSKSLYFSDHCSLFKCEQVGWNSS